MKLLLVCLLVGFVAAAEKKKSLANGFPDTVDWVEWKNAVGVAKDLNKPIFFLIHKTWCGACKGLQREFKSSPKFGELLDLSKKFVMVNVEDDEEPEEERYSPDGGYIPRILFLDTDAAPLQTNNEQKYKNNKYFYPLIVQIIDGMERALLEFGDEPTEEKKAEKPVEKKEDKEEKKTEEKEETNSVEEEVVEEKTEEKVEEVKEEKTEKKEDKKKSEKKEKKEKKPTKEDKDEL